MKVLILTNMYPPHHYGGYELNCQEFADHLRAAGHEVLVLTSDIEVPGVAAEPEDHAQVRRRLSIYWEDHVMLRPGARECLVRERRNQAALTKAIADLRPDVVSAWHMGAMSLGLLCTCHARGLPVVYVVNDDWLLYASLVDRWMRRWRRTGPLAVAGERCFGVPCRLPNLRALGWFCFITNITRQGAERRWRGRFRTATVSYCGINVDQFPVATHSRGDSPWAWRLLTVGRIDYRKGIDTAIRALAQLPPSAMLDVIGRGDRGYLETLEALASDLGVRDRVKFGVATREELAAKYAAADAFLFPTRWAEPFGLVPLEAMACSLPVVATGTGGSSEILLDNINCLLTPVDDDRALADAVRRVADDRGLRERLVAAGHATASELTLPRWLAILDAWHAAAVTGGDPPPDRTPIREVLARAIGVESPSSEAPDALPH